MDAGGDPARIASGGESAGAGLAAATLLAARHAGLPHSAAVLLLSPWVDLPSRPAAALSPRPKPTRR
ncbi:alpha/beta hydrolase fold domain-containing protein [Streptomyces mirabilis]|uniref:alpha/beta hydrolase fold domain-containing protein n=1 Tax=Streptomyces mirabilis TaxID=68239 RepID=UPI0036970DEB